MGERKLSVFPVVRSNPRPPAPVTTALLLVIAVTAVGQTRGRRADYALVLDDAPVIQTAPSRLALRGKESQTHLQSVRNAQSGVIAELHRRKIAVTGATQVLVNAVIISAAPESIAEL